MRKIRDGVGMYGTDGQSCAVVGGSHLVVAYLACQRVPLPTCQRASGVRLHHLSSLVVRGVVACGLAFCSPRRSGAGTGQRRADIMMIEQNLRHWILETGDLAGAKANGNWEEAGVRLMVGTALFAAVVGQWAVRQTRFRVLMPRRPEHRRLRRTGQLCRRMDDQ